MSKSSYTSKEEKRKILLEVYAETSRELGIPLSEVRKIMEHQSKFTRAVIEKGSFDTVRWPGIGKFEIRIKKLQMLNEKKGLKIATVQRKQKDKRN